MGTKIKSKFWSRRRVYERFQFIANLVTLISFIYIAVVPISSAKAVVTVNLNNAPQSMGYGTGSTCPRDPNVYGSYTDDVWHLVASQGNFLDASGNILGAVGTWNVPNIYRGMMKDTSKPAQLWMYTQHIDGVTTIMTGGTAILTDGGTKFVISHTCPGLTSNTLLTTPTSNQTFYPSTLPTSINTAASTSSLALGASLTDRADIDIKTGTAAPTGTVSFYYCYNATTAITSCTSTANLVGTSSSFTRSGTTSIYQSTSPTFVPAQAGYYAFYATYSGDGNYTGSSETDVVGETFQVTGPPTRATPTVASTAGTNPIKLGQTITDTVVVSGTNGTPTGSVTFYYCYNATTYSWTTNKCTVGGAGAQSATQIGAPVTLTSGSAVSPTFTPANAGYYSFLAVYSGDTNYLAGNDPGTNEAFTVNPLTAVTIATQASQTSIIQGGSLTDLATFTAASASGTFGGTATFYYCQSSSTITSCNASSSPAPILIGSTSTFTTLGSPANTYTATSPTFYPSSVGNYAFYVTYSGNANYAAANATSITNETFTVSAGDLRATPTITSVAGTNPIKVGQTITDVVTITSTGTTPTGTVTFTYCYNASAYPSAASCTAGTQIGAPVTISGGTASSPNFTPTQAGFYIFHAAYSGDLNTKPGVDSGTNETFKVDPLLVPTITTSASVSNLDLTGSLTDSVTVSGSGATPTGSVSFYYCFSSSAAISSVSTCASTATLIGSSNLSSGTARSPTFTPSRAGYYAFYTVYSGDVNYVTANASSISGETFRVWPSSSTSSITTTTGKTTLSIGGSLTDIATVVGDGYHVPTGTVTFYYCYHATVTPTSCTSTSGTQIGLPRTLSGTSPYTATSPSFTPGSVGMYRFAAVYSGDSYYSSSAETNGSNETFEVTAIPAPTITTTASTNVVLLGSSLTDQATITLASTGTAPTGTVTFYYCYNASTALTSCNSTTNLVGSTTTISSTADTKIFTATSPSFTPALLGYYAFYATYSGDSNYGSSADASVTNETFRVMPVNGTPDVTSQTSSTSVGLTNSVTDLATIAGDGVHVPTGTVTFYYCYSSSSYSWTTAGQSCSVTGTSGSAREAKQIGSPVTIAATSPYTATSSSFTPADNGYYTFLAVYSGDSYYNPGTDTGSNENFQVSALAAPTVTTSASSTSIILGNSLSDQATLSFSPDASRPTGYTKFYYCFNSTTDITSCDASNYTGYIGQSNSYSGTSPGPTFTVNSPSFTPTQTGKYAFFASFQGDTGHAAAADTSVSGETFQVSAAGLISSSITTSRSSATIGLGQSITDVATVTGSGATPTGKVTFYYCYDAVSTPTCSATLGTQIGAQITLSSGTATSASFTPTQVGFYKFFAVYSGSSTYSSSSETTGTNENFEVTALTVPTSISTTASATSVVLGNSLTDAVTVNFGQTSPTPSGTVSFYYCYNSASAVSSCTSTANLIGTSSLSISSATGTATSPSFTPRDLGYYAFYAVYNGDSNYSTKAASSVTNEQFQVVAATLVGSTTTTTAASTTLKLGNSITDTATVTRTSGSGATPTGAVTFYYCYNSTSYDWTAANQGCVVGGSGARAATQIGSPVALNGSGVAVSPSFTPGSNGYYTFYSVYSGDSIYSTSYDSGANENFQVSARTSPSSISTSRSASTLTLGNSLTDLATVVFPSGTAPTGTVSFYYCYNSVATGAVSSCTSTANFIGSSNITLSTGTTYTATSPSFIPSTTGYYAFYAVYNGDSNYNSLSASSVTNETFQVTASGSKTTPAFTTAVSSTAPGLNTAVTDLATVTWDGTNVPTGKVTFYYCFNASIAPTSCTNGTQFGTQKTLSGTSPYTATSDNFMPPSYGYYMFHAVYSGDSNYNLASDSGANESFVLNYTTAGTTVPTFTTLVKSGSPSSAVTQVNLGASVTDTVSLSGSNPTGTVYFYYCYSPNSFAEITPCVTGTNFDSTTFTNSGGNSKTYTTTSFTPTKVGFYVFHAIYSGDSNTKGAVDDGTGEIVEVKDTASRTTSIATQVKSGSPLASVTAIDLGNSITDVATLTFSSSYTAPANPGSVYFYYCYNASVAVTSCTSTTNYIGSTQVTGSGTSISVNSPTFFPTAAGYYAIYAVFKGDTAASGVAASTVTNEQFQVNQVGLISTTTASTASSSSVALGQSLTDSVSITKASGASTLTGNVTFYYCFSATSYNWVSNPCVVGGSGAKQAIQIGTPVTVSSGAATSSSFTPSNVGYYTFYSVYSGDATYASSYDTGVNENFQVTALSTPSSISTAASSSSIAFGNSLTDVATIIFPSASPTPTGTVSFYYCYSATTSPASCNSTTNLIGSTSISMASATGTATSPSFTPANTGYYAFYAVYNGDSNWNSIAATSVSGETFSVGLKTSTITTTRGATTTLAYGDSLTDTATVSGSGGTPSGTVTFYYCYSSSSSPTCTSGNRTQIGSPVTLSGGVAVSPSFTPNSDGYYRFQAVYNGDSTFGTATDGGTNEDFTVTFRTAPSSITTSRSDANINLGQSITDVATVSPSAATGTVSFYYCYSASAMPTSCTSTANYIGDGTLSGGSANSPSFTPTAIGYYAFYAVYNGSATYTSLAASSVTNETFRVWPTLGTATVTTTPSKTSLALGSTLTDTATIVGDGTHTPTGTVTFYYCYSTSVISSCTSGTQFGSPVTVSGSSTYTAVSDQFSPASAPVYPALGYYMFHAVYSGDTYYSSAEDSGAGETFTVTGLAATTLTTTASSSSFTIGASVYDTATINLPTNRGAPTGSVTFYYCYDANAAVTSCNSTTNSIGTSSTFTRVGATDNYTVTSPTFTPANVGYYAFYAVYGGDGNYSGSSDSDITNEKFQVIAKPVKKNSTITTAPNLATLYIGNSLTDVATVSGTGGTPTGTVNFYYCYSSNTSYDWVANPCSPSGSGETLAKQVGLQKTLSSGTATSDSFTPDAIGSYIFHAVYGGDSDFLTSSDTGSGETFMVTARPTTTISTSVSNSEFTIGGSVTDTAYINVSTVGGVAPTGTVNFYYCYDASTAITSCDSTTNLVSSTTGPFNRDGTSDTYTVTSDAFVPSAAGYYAFYATYSGNLNYSGSNETTLTNETFKVNAAIVRTTPGVATTAEVSTIKIGQSLTDAAVITGTGDRTPTGTVTFYYCYSSTAYSWTTAGHSCSVGGSGAQEARQVGTPVALVSGSATSASFTPNSIGYYTFHAVYSGDTYYLPNEDSGTGENFEVQKLPDTTITTTVSEVQIDLGHYVTDTATVTSAVAGTITGTVDFYYCYDAANDVNTCGSTSPTLSYIGQSTISSVGGNYIAVSDRFYPSEVGFYAFYAVYNGSSDYTGSNETSTANETFEVKSNVTRATPAIVTAASSSSFVLGNSVHDSATVTGVSGKNLTGMVTFYYCYSATSITSCDGKDVTQFGGSKTLPGDGTTSQSVESDDFTPTQSGYYVFHARYSGNDVYENIDDSTGAAEAFHVIDKTSTSISTTASKTSLKTGAAITDAATLTLASYAGSAPTGTMSFYYCFNASAAVTACTSTANLIGSTNTFTATGDNKVYTTVSPTFNPASEGYYSFAAVYSGDSNYAGYSDTSTVNETFKVTPDRGNATVTTSPSSTTIRIGQSLTDVATITGDGVNTVTGTVTFSYCYSGVSFAAITTPCTSGTQIGTPVAVSGGSATSPSFTPTNVGYYIFHAVYSGDTFYNSSSDTGAGETFSVIPKTNTSIDTTAGSTSILVGSTISDTATVRLVTANGAPTGTVKFYYCYKSDTSTPVASCTSTTNLISTQSTFTATADPKNYTVNSGAFTPIAVGSYAFYAVYSGDAIYSGSAETSVAGETFTVNTKPRTPTAITTVPSSRSINYGDTINDVATVTTASGTPTGSVTFYYCYSATSISSCTNGTQIGSPVALSGTAPFKATSPDFTPAYGGYYMFHAVYSGDADFASSEDNGSGEDFVMIATSPTTVTTTSSLSTLALGNTVSDTAIINIGSKTVAPTGNVKFYYCYDTTTFTDPCTATNKLISTVYSPFTFVSTGNYSVNSGTFTPPNEGKYVFYAVYSGDGNYTTSADTSITNETFTVTPFTRTNTTTTTTIGSTSPIVFGQSIKDNVTVAPTTGTGTPTGTVTFFYCYSSSTYNWVANPCSVGGSGAQEAKQFGSPVTLSAGKATSQSFVPAAVGFYSFHAEYSGDATYNSSIDTGAGENFEVSKYTTTLTTKASNTTLTFGNSITDVATISVGGGVNDPTGTVTFSYCFSSVAAPTIATCPTWTNFDTQSTFTANADGTGYVATSKSFTPAAVGYYLFHAAYSGDSTYSSSEDNGVNENFRVLGNIASTTTTSASATNITLGQQVRDNVTVTGTGSQIPTGTVTFSYCYSLSPITSCTSGTALGSAVALSPSTTPTAVATSILFTPTRAGYYMFHAVYGGDAYYLTSQDAGTNESFFVTGKSTTITTVSSSTSINLGSTISDMATLNIGTGTVAPTGNVKFYYCYDPVNPNINCSSTTNYFGQSTTFTNTSGSLYTIASPTFTPNAAGNYAFYAVYSGDGNYATSADTDATWERFVVVEVPRTTPTVTTQASASTIKLGDSITDIATVTGTTGVPVTGTVIFSYCYSATSITSCTGLTTTQIGSPATLSATAPYRVQSPVFTPDTGGYYVFKATYSGSSRYTIASDDGTNENFFVSTPTNTTITTAASLSTFALGVSNTDVVTLDVGSGTAIPSGTVTFYYCFDDTNVITTCNSTANRVGSSTTFNYVSGSTYTITSPIFTPTKVGNYVYYAVYSGDANYKGSTDGSTVTEAFSVTEPELRATPTVATTASKSTLAIGDSLTDAVTVTGDGSNIPSGTVTFYYCYSTTAVGSCATANATQIGDPVILDNEGKATSPVFTPSKGGYYKFHAVYSGDTNFKDAVDPSAASEAFVVSAISTSITTTASTGTLDLGGTITDVATIDVGSGTQDPTGSVSFYYCYQSDTSTPIAKCDASTPTTRLGSVSTFVHTVGSLYNVTSPVFTPALAGNYAFFAVYSGDSTYNESSDSDISHELFTVSVPAGGDTRANSQVDTTASVNTLNLGESVYDNALVSQVASSPLMIAPVTPVAFATTDPSRPLTGTLTWYYCYNPSSAATGCNSTIGTQFSDPIPVGYGTSTVQSPSFTPLVAGYYAFHAVYSGDGSYKMAYDPSGASEQFLVKGGSTPPGGGGGGTPPGGGYTPPSTPDKSPEKPTPGKPGKTSIQGDVPSWIKTGFSRLTNSSATPTPSAEPSTTPAPKKATTTPKTTTSKKPVVKAKPTPTKPFKFPVAAVPNAVFDPAKCNLPMGKSRTAGQVNYRGTHVRVIPITYPKGGVLTPPPYTDVAAISVRHQPISATEGSTLIVWHVDWNGCVGALDPLANSHIGDTLNIVDENGVSHILRITANFNVPKGKYQKSWFMLSGKRQFIFVTCAGKVVNYHYLDNKIIMAVPVN